MAFAEVDYELEVRACIEPESESLEDRVNEPDTACQCALELGNPETPSASGSIEGLPGLGALIRMLRVPGEFFGSPSERLVMDRGESVDWESAPDEIGEFLDHWGTRCSDVLFHLHLAAEVLRKHGVRICVGEMSILFLHEEDTMDIYIELSIDATWKQASDLTRELDGIANQVGVPYRGFCFSFIQGAGDEDADEKFDWDQDLD